MPISRVAVVGASGFIGRNLCRMLTAAGRDVSAYGQSEHREAIARGLPPDVEYRRLDLAAERPAFEPGTDVVYFLAQSPAYREFPQRADSLFGVNMLGLVRSATAAVDAGVRFFCHASTGNVYRQSFDPMGEATPLRRDDPYALSKIAAEEALQLFQAHLPASSVRIFGAFGPGQTGMLVPRIRDRAAAGEPIVIQPSPRDAADDGGLRVSFCFVDDLCRSLLRLADRVLEGMPPPPALNLAGPEAISIRKLAEEIGRALGRTPKFDLSTAARTGDLVADTSLQNRLVEPQFTPFCEAIARSV